MKTVSVKPADVKKQWTIVDASGKTLGRLATEIARILRKYKIAVSENRSGIFFDMLKLPQEVFEELLTFREFVQKNNAELEKRQEELSA